MNNLKINKFIVFERLTAISLIAAVLNDEQRLLRNLFQNYSKSSRPVLKRIPKWSSYLEQNSNR